MRKIWGVVGLLVVGAAISACSSNPGASSPANDESSSGELVVEVHVPFERMPGADDDESDYPYLETIEEYLFALDGEHGEMYDDAEEFGDEYLFFVSGASEPELIALARQIAALPGVPSGVYVTVTDSDADMGSGRVVEL